MDIGVGDLVEDVDGGGDMAGKRVSGDELGSDVEVLLEMGFEELSVDLFDELKVSAFVEVREFVF